MARAIKLPSETFLLVRRVKALLVLHDGGKPVTNEDTISYALDMAEASLMAGLGKPKKKGGEVDGEEEGAEADD